MAAHFVVNVNLAVGGHLEIKLFAPFKSFRPEKNTDAYAQVVFHKNIKYRIKIGPIELALFRFKLLPLHDEIYSVKTESLCLFRIFFSVFRRRNLPTPDGQIHFIL